MRRHFVHVAVLAALAACLPAAAQLPEPVARVLAEQGLASDAVSLLVLRGDQTVLAHLAERPMQPASTMKLVTTLVGLEHRARSFAGVPSC
ncbi:hypothetical protein [Massilia sp. Dwa41.01b]|uniref:hypothetical protein n=1 Tax=Massilia sp. Dwa41.01b TaxID=2709302 RepID=UPI00280470A9|nr:hypothetical protein [Massilia sp. Dwa41.01b]